MNKLSEYLYTNHKKGCVAINVVKVEQIHIGDRVDHRRNMETSQGPRS